MELSRPENSVSHPDITNVDGQSAPADTLAADPRVARAREEAQARQDRDLAELEAERRELKLAVMAVKRRILSRRAGFRAC